MSFEEAEILRERAEAFLRNAKRMFSEGDYDLAAFCVEQFCQLLVKHRLLIETGTYPRTHSLIRLLRALSMARGGELDDFLEEEVLNLTRLEDAYVVSRYLPRRYERREVEVLLSFAESFREAVEGEGG